VRYLQLIDKKLRLKKSVISSITVLRAELHVLLQYILSFEAVSEVVISKKNVAGQVSGCDL